MKRSTQGLLGIVVAGMAGYLITRSVQKTRTKIHDAAARWHTITVNRLMNEIGGTQGYPEPLKRIMEMVEVSMHPALAGTATEIAVRLREPGSATSSAALHEQTRHIRSALRRTQMLLETGEILEPNKPGSVEPTIFNKPLRYVTTHSRQEGRL